MRQTTHAKTGKKAAAHADPFAYDLPLTHHGHPVPAPPAPTNSQIPEAWGKILFAANLLLLLFVRPGGRSFIYYYAALCAAAMVASYWQGERPKQSFVSWTLKVVGIWLNLYVAFVTVPVSLRGLLPEEYAFGLPAFVMTLVYYWVRPAKPSDTPYPLWRWVAYAALVAIFWGLNGAALIK
jgi:hypothetical protein